MARGVLWEWEAMRHESGAGAGAWRVGQAFRVQHSRERQQPGELCSGISNNKLPALT